MSSESTRVILLDTVIGDLVSTRRIQTPMLVLGGAADRVYTPDDVRRTAAAYNTEPVILPGMGHEVMLEPSWQVAADHIGSWLARRGL
jgi:pimeloyl-ACP methyl ester carboxylesterase